MLEALIQHQEDCSANFVSGKLTLVGTDHKGLDVIANQIIHRGESLVMYGGGFVDRAHIHLIPTSMRPFFFEVADGIWFGHGFDEAGLGIAERLNHSCNPSAGFDGIAHVIALRDIQPGESVTLDYSALQSEDLEGSSFECACGSCDCRLQVSVHDWQKVRADDPLIRHMQPFIQSRIAPKASADAAYFSEITFPLKWHSPQHGGRLQSTLVSQSIELIKQGTARARARARARSPIRKGEAVFIASGKVIPKYLLNVVEKSLRAHTRPLTKDLYVVPRSSSDITPSQVARVDDSRSNVVLRLGHIFVATRDIAVGEEIILHSNRLQLHASYSPDNSDIISSSPETPASVGKPLRLRPARYSRGSRGGTKVTTISNGGKMARRAISAINAFVKGAVLEDWMAAPIAFIGSMASTFTTAFCVAAIAPAFERLFQSTSSASYVIATSTTAIILGYASYCLFYYSGMVIKEYNQLRDETGSFSKELLRKRFEIFKWDFLLHLPSDGYWVFGMFGVQGGLYASGATDLFWSVVAAQGLSDVYYSLREPFYWRAAKKSAEWRLRRAQNATEAANRDIIEPTVQENVGNA